MVSANGGHHVPDAGCKDRIFRIILPGGAERCTGGNGVDETVIFLPGGIQRVSAPGAAGIAAHIDGTFHEDIFRDSRIGRWFSICRPHTRGIGISKIIYIVKRMDGLVQGQSVIDVHVIGGIVPQHPTIVFRFGPAGDCAAVFFIFRDMGARMQTVTKSVRHSMTVARKRPTSTKGFGPKITKSRELHSARRLESWV